MGRIKTKNIKRVSHQLMELYGDKFSKNYEENTKILSNYLKVSSKKLRNIIAGYLSRLKRQEGSIRPRSTQGDEYGLH